jgi:Arc/MetJ-type ribon-helix-helix transcriptional regulator
VAPLAAIGGFMGVVQIQLPDDLQQIIDRQVAEGRAANQADYVDAALRRYAEDLELDNEIVAEAGAGIVDIKAGRYTTISSPEDVDALHDRTMNRLHGRLAALHRQGENAPIGDASGLAMRDDSPPDAGCVGPGGQ